MTIAGKAIRRPRFDASISLGSVLTFIAGSAVVPFLVWVVQDNARQDNRLTAVETSVAGLIRRAEDGERRTEEARGDLRNGLRHLDSKVTTILLAIGGRQVQLVPAQ